MTEGAFVDATDVDLAFALCHEIGNCLGAIRLHAHLIDDEMSRRELAGLGVEVDDLCGRSAALLAHVRPLLSGPPERSEAVDPGELVASLRDVALAHGGRGVRLDFSVEPALGPVQIDREVLHHLLQSLLFCALESAGGEGAVRLSAAPGAPGVAFALEDDGDVREDPADFRETTPRGRPLVCRVAERILARRGGRLEVTRDSGWTRVVLRLPA